MQSCCNSKKLAGGACLFAYALNASLSSVDGAGILKIWVAGDRTDFDWEDGRIHAWAILTLALPRKKVAANETFMITDNYDIWVLINESINREFMNCCVLPGCHDGSMNQSSSRMSTMIKL